MLSQLDRLGKSCVVELNMEKLWWKRPRTTKHPRTTNDTFVKLSNYKNLPIKKNTLVTPVRKCYLPYGHWFRCICDEEYDMIVDTYLGLGIISLKDVEW